MPRKLLIFLCALGFCSFLNKEPKLKCHKSFTPAQLNSDFDLLISTLKEIHPDLYRVNSQSQLEKRIKEIKSSIKSEKTYLEFLKLLAPLFTDIGCINTQWGHSPEYIEFRNDNIPIFPLQLSIQGEKFFIQNNYSSNAQIAKGDEIIKINGESTLNYLRKNYLLLPTDGKINTIQRRWLETYFPQHHSNFWEQPDSFRLEIKTMTGIIETNVSALLKKEIQKKKNSPSLSEKPGFVIREGVGVLSIHSFEPNNGHEAFIDSCFMFLKTNKVENLIIDMKGEGSGSFTFGQLLYSYVALDSFKYVDQVHIKGDSIYKYSDPGITFAYISGLAESLSKVTTPNKNAFKGNLYVLTDGWTIGTKGLFCAKASERPKTYFVGEETGSTKFGMNGFPVSISLPNTGIQVYIPTTQLVMNRKNYKEITGVVPNYPFAETESELLIKKTLEIIGKQ